MARSFSLVHLSDSALLQGLTDSVSRENASTAWVVAHIAEVYRRKLFVPAGYPSMREYCVHELRLSEDAAKKRIQVALAALELPVIFEALADGKVHLSGLRLLVPHLTAGNVDALLAAATHKSKAEIEQLIAERVPKSEMMPLIERIPSATHVQSGAPGHPDAHVAAGESGQGAASPMSAAIVKPVAPQRFGLHCTIDQEIRDLLQQAEELASPVIPPGDVTEILRRSLKLFVATEHKRKFGTGTTPRKNLRYSTNGRYVPKHVRRAVWKRDGGRCTFESESGVRCSCRRGLQFDHIILFCLGGEATFENLRLRCHSHNQYEAEQALGAGFMHRKREEARRAAAEQRPRTPSSETRTDAIARGETMADARGETMADAIARAKATAVAEAAGDRDVTPWLRALGFRADEARRAATFCETVDLPLQERVRVALSYLRPGGVPGSGGIAAASS